MLSARSRLRRAVLCPAGAALLAMAPTVALAQTIEGTVLDGQTGDPVAQAYIALVTEDQESVVAVTADTFGSFSLDAPHPGSYFLYVSALGYRPAADGMFELGENGSMEVEVRLEPEPVMLDSIRASVDRTDRYLRQVGFYERRGRGWGKHLTHEEIRERAVVFLGDALLNMHRVYVRDGFPYPRVFMRKGIHTCSPHIFLDGMLVHRGGVDGDGPAVPDEYVHPQDVAAMEVYSSWLQAPEQYALQDTCGVILIWTWHG